MVMKIPLIKSPAKGLCMLVFLIVFASLSVSCSKKEEAKDIREVTELRYQGWTGRVLYPELAEDLGYLKPLKLKWVGNTISGPQDIQATATGDIDFGGAFSGAIIKLKANGSPIKMVISYYGLDSKTNYGYYVLNESPIRKARDLIGKQIAVNTLGAHQEFVAKEYLARQGLTNAEIRQVSLVVIPPINAEQVLRQKQVEVAVMGDILQDKALERGGIRPLFTDYELFGELSMGGYVLTEKFIRENPNAARKFVEATARAIEWAQTHPREEVIARMEKIVSKRGRNEDTSALKYWKSTGVDGKGGVVNKREISVWIDWLVRDGQLRAGQIKPSDVYTNEFNPYRAEAKEN